MKAVKHFVMVTILILCTVLVVLSQATAYADDKLNSWNATGSHLHMSLIRGNNSNSSGGASIEL